MDECQRCSAIEDDLRNIWMACSYEMNELGLPLKKKYTEDVEGNKYLFYILRVCKNCRGTWMSTQINWFNHIEPVNEFCGSAIFIREFGALKEISEEEWHKRNPGIEPIRYFYEKV